MSQNKLLTGVLMLGLSSAALASGVMPPAPAAPEYSPGLYIGAQGGWAYADEGKGFKDSAKELYDKDLAFINSPNSRGGTVTNSHDQGGFGGRVFLGYSFMRYFGLEAGYTFFPDNKYHTSATFDDLPMMPDDLSFKVKTYAIDLMAKGVLPLEQDLSSGEGWSLFAKLGAAYEHCKWESSFTTGGVMTTASNAKGSVRPAYGAGIAYNFNNNFSMDLSYTGIYGQHRVSLADVDNVIYAGDQAAVTAAAANVKPLPITHLVALGLIYKFDM